MAWKALNLRSTLCQVDDISDALMQLGALSVSIEDADASTVHEQALFDEGVTSPKFWQHNLVRALFASDANLDQTIKSLQQAFGKLHHTIENLEEQNWLELVQSQLQPICINQRLWIVPSWHELPDVKAHFVRLDPGLAFGTGTHPSTRLCLEWLTTQHLQHLSVLDYGCGSGILAIAAKMLGASYVRAVDIDSQAIAASASNADKNGIDIEIELIDVHASPGGGAFDIVLANILSKTLISLADRLASTCGPNAKIALSGILEAQSDEVVAAFAPWFQIQVESSLEGWVLLVGKRHCLS